VIIDKKRFMKLVEIIAFEMPCGALTGRAEQKAKYHLQDDRFAFMCAWQKG